MQAHAKVCKENKLEKTMPIIYFLINNHWAVSSAGVLRFYTIVQIMQLEQWL